MPQHLSKIQERGYESKSIQEGREEEGIGESGYREGEGANVNGAGCLPAACPPAGRPACPGSIFGCALRYKIGGSPVINEGKFLPPPLSTNAALRAADIDCVEKFLMLESTDYWIAEVRFEVISHKKCLFKLHL